MTAILGSIEDVEQDKMMERIMSARTHLPIGRDKIGEVDFLVPMLPHAQSGDSIEL